MNKKSLSKYIYYNLKNIKCQDSDGNLMNGVKIDVEEFEHGTSTLIRFVNGYLDGDVFSKNGKFKMQLPAVKSKNHLEFWRKNKLHRDGGLPAIISGNPPQYEWWEIGIRIK